MKKHWCENCRFQAYAERKPKSIIAWLWRWHAKWCPVWKGYQRRLDEEAAKEKGSGQ